ncbi:hypothetical protein [Pseudonocardia sp. 73-21]|uniref:hypothetical protein n=1 Tax=Pseudonocardia sp. 73-21 TaxID=1895809 RepID=UPI002612A023|nr:hypothetical protein [Pseudonocardia sp. 73-21]
MADFANFTRSLISELFAPEDPVTIHRSRTPRQLADDLIEFKPRFIHHPESIAHVRRITTALGADPGSIHADVPKLRTAFPDGGLNTGIAYAFQAHRDTWYGAPPQQINWWMPVWPAAAENVMEFYPRWFGTAIENNSSDYNYYVANTWRSRIKDFSGASDVRVHPAPVHGLPADEPRLCLVPPVGGIMLFSGDQLHASIPNRTPATRYSIDFRTVNVTDVREGRAAPRADVECVGTALRDFRRLSDGAEFSEDDVAPYDTAGAQGVKVFTPS